MSVTAQILGIPWRYVDQVNLNPETPALKEPRDIYFDSRRLSYWVPPLAFECLVRTIAVEWPLQRGMIGRLTG